MMHTRAHERTHAHTHADIDVATSPLYTVCVIVGYEQRTVKDS